MLIACDIVFKKLIAEHLPNERNTFDVLRHRLLNSLAFLSGLRWLNDSEDLGLNFDGLALANFYDKVHLTLDETKCIAAIDSRSPNKKRAIQATEVEVKVSGINDYYNLCNGHDAVKALALHITAVGDRKGIKDDVVASALRVAYRKEDFTNTKLYKHLKNWEQQTEYALF